MGLLNELIRPGLTQHVLQLLTYQIFRKQTQDAGETKGHTLLSFAWAWKRLGEELGGHFECQVKK